MFETFYLQTIFNSPVFILKKELLLIPIFGWYLKKIKSQVAELSNASLDGMAGSITAALFLKEFLNKSDTPWLHFDTYAWSQGSILGSNGAALQGLEIMSEFLRKNFN